jgi:hypothetical protein
MSRRRLLLFGVAVVVMGVGVFWLFLWWTSPRINQESYSKLKIGMKKAEVISILNCNPHYAPGEFGGEILLGCTMSTITIEEEVIGLGGTVLTMTIEEEGYVWVSSECRIYVRFNAESNVAGLMCSSDGNCAESLFEKIRRWLHL